jgi:hypothetical protein
MCRRIKILEHSHFEHERLFACLYSLLTPPPLRRRVLLNARLQCGCFCSIFSFFSLHETVRSKFVTLGTHTHTPKRFLSLERERERGPFFLPKAFGRCCCTRRRRTLETLSSSKALFAFLFSVKERKRERIIKWRLATLLRGRIPRTMMERRLYP